MPVSRTMPMKAMKTERTHEENQERAYIAASRRSDRSLEARVESARRASEIHKRRTGRGLKITVEDVANEEMYEEEDTHVPIQFSQLASHLTTGHPGFNERLSAYLQSNVAIRGMLINAVQNSYGPQGGPTMAPGQAGGMYQSQQYQPIPQAQSPSSYRQVPYPSPRPTQQQGQQPNHYHRMSLPGGQTPQPVYSPTTSTADDHRRGSMPTVVGLPAASPRHTDTPTSAHSTPSLRPAMSSRQSSNYGLSQQALPQQAYPAYSMNAYHNNDFSLSPLTTQLPAEAQGLLGSTLDMNDPINAMMMAGSANNPSAFYDFGAQQQPTSKNANGQQTHATMDGLGSTLAPSASESMFNNFGQSNTFFNEGYSSDNKAPTPAITPGDDANWESWMDDSWNDLPGSQSSQS